LPRSRRSVSLPDALTPAALATCAWVAIASREPWTGIVPAAVAAACFAGAYALWQRRGEPWHDPLVIVLVLPALAAGLWIGVGGTLLDVARSDPSVDVRSDAIQWLSQTRSEAAIPALDSVLFQSREEEIRKKAIFALSQMNRDERARAALQRAAQDEKMPEELREEAVFWLGQSRTADLTFFRNLFRSTRNTDLQKKIIFSVSQQRSAESSAWLLDMAKDKSFDTEIRKEAIFWLSQGRQLDMDALQGIYTGARDDQEIQKQVIFVYSQSRQSAAVDKLMEIAKTDPKIENRKDAIFWLGQKNDPRVKQFLRDLLK